MRWFLLLSLALTLGASPADTRTDSDRRITIVSPFGPGPVGGRTLVINPDGSVSRHRQLWGLYDGPDCRQRNGGHVDYSLIARFMRAEGALVPEKPRAYESPNFQGALSVDSDPGFYDLSLQDGPDREYRYEIRLDDWDPSVPKDVRTIVVAFDNAMKGCPGLSEAAVESARPASVRWSLNYGEGGIGGGWDVLIDSDGRTFYHQSKGPLVRRFTAPADELARLDKAVGPLFDAKLASKRSPRLDCTHRMKLERYGESVVTTARDLLPECIASERAPETSAVIDALYAIRATIVRE